MNRRTAETASNSSPRLSLHIHIPMKTAPIFLLALGTAALAASAPRAKQPDTPHPVNLAAVMRLAGGRNLDIRIAEDYARQVRQAVDAGIAFKGDAFRATAQVERNEVERSKARGQQRVAAARLAQILHLPAQVELLPGNEPVTFSFGDSRRSLGVLIEAAIVARPEMAMSADQLEAAMKNSD